MAMRQRGGGAAATPSRIRPSSGGIWPVFKDFKPTSEWQQYAESHNLIIYLPGFFKEQIRVSTEGRDIIRVRGERLIGGNIWSRFLEDFQVPENCEMSSIHARFQEGTLIITVPKKSVEKPQEALAPKTTSADTQKQPTPQKGQEAIPPAVGASPPTDQRNLETDNTSDDPRKRAGEVQKARVVLQDAVRKESSSPKEKQTGPERADGTLRKPVTKEEKYSERSKESPKDEMTMKMKLKTDDGAAATSGAKEEDTKSKFKQVIQSSTADYGAFTMDRYKKALKGIADLNEESQLMVNMGVAVLFIMALSAYVTYKFATGDDKK